jgi:virginiamycin B lyase
LPLVDFISAYALPVQLLTPNGITFSDDGLLWIADTTSSSFFSFDPSSEEFIQYVTADPMFETYGNQTGVIKSPISRPYWIENDDQGRLVFNEQTANNISVMDPKTQSLIEYHIPSKNPNWGDCSIMSESDIQWMETIDESTGITTMTQVPEESKTGMYLNDLVVLDDCGIAQIFDFTISGDKIWFTEWVENKIGVVDTSVPLPLEIQLEYDALNLLPGTSANFHFIISPQFKNGNLELSSIASTTHDFLTVNLIHGSVETFELDSDNSIPVHVDISASDDALSGTYKILLGVQSDDVTISKFLTVIIE